MILVLLVVAAIVVVIGSITLFIQKVVLKNRMQRGLGRKVEDGELTSITTWMRASSPSEAGGSQTAKQDERPLEEPFPKPPGTINEKESVEPASLKRFVSHAAQRTSNHAYYRVGYELAAWSILFGYIAFSVLLIVSLAPISKIVIPLGLIVTALSFRLFREKAKRYAINTERVIKRDERVPILYLRSFAHDASKGSWSQKAWKPSDAFEQPYTKATELQLTSAFAPIGPLVVVGEPGEEVPGVGGVRLYFDSQDWQEKVQELMRISRFVIIHPGKTAGVEWEMAAAKGLLDPNRLVFVFASWHSLKKYGRQIEYDIFASQLKTIFQISLPEQFNGAYFLYFTNGWNPRFAFPIWYKRWVFKGRSEVALQTSLGRILKDANTTVR